MSTSSARQWHALACTDSGGCFQPRSVSHRRGLRAAPVSRALLLGSRIASSTLIALALLAGIYAAAIAILATLLLVMLGGAWVPTFIFPEWLQSATLVVPTRWAVDGLDAMTWRGLGIEAALAPIAAMLAFSALFALIAVKRFDWEE